MKTIPWVIMLPEDWKPKECDRCICGGTCSNIKTYPDDSCPLANAKKAVELGTNQQYSINFDTFNGKMYGVETPRKENK